MSLTRREFVRVGGPSLAAGSVIACLGCSHFPRIWNELLKPLVADFVFS